MPGHLKVQEASGHGLNQKLRGNNTAILADTLHFETLAMHEWAGTILNPTSVLEALTNNEISYHVWVATKKVFDSWQKEKFVHTKQERIARVIDVFLIELANAIADRVAGPHVAFIDPRGHDNTRSMFESACRLHDLFRSQGVAKENIIVSIPATEAGILAAQRLQKVQVNVNLYLVSSLMHAAACAETNAAAISISVGTLLDLYEWNRKTVYQDLNAHPGIQAIQSILAYFKFNGIGTKVIGTTFRNMAELGLLSEFDAVCISREQADRLKWSKVPVASLENANLSVALRARQAKYPTELLTREGGFLACFSPESRKLTNGILHDALMKMQGEMDAIEDIVAQEVERQFRLGTLDLKTLYKFPSKSKRKSEGDEEKSEHETMDTSAKFENWSREMAGLGLDEVF